MKANFGNFLRIVTLMALLTTGLGLSARASEKPVLAETTAATFPVIADFETENVDDWFTYGDGGTAITKTVALTNTLSALGVTSNTVMLVDYISAGWGVGVGKDLVPFQDWSDYDGFSFWFQGTNSGTEFKIVLTDNDGERLATKFLDDFTGWQELRFPWQVFYWDPDYQPDWGHNDGPTLTAVEAFAFAPAAPSTGSYAMDRIALFKDIGTVINDFQTDDVSGWFTYGDGGTAITKTVALTNTLSALGVTSNTVMLVDYISAGWGVGVGQDLIPFQDWSDYDGFSFWFQGTNSGTEFKIVLTDNDGERLATKFLDDFTGWQELRFPWQVFYWDPDYQPDWGHNDGPTLTAVEAFAFAPAAPSTGSYAMDRIALFKDIGTVINDFQTDDVSGWFTYGDGGTAITKTVALTNTLSALGVTSNTVMLVDYISAGWGVGVGQDLIPFQDWSDYDGFSFWFQGTNSGTEFKIVLTDNDGERLATKFLDDFTGWQELCFPWQVFYWDPDYQPDWGHNDGPTLTAVEAFAFAPAAPSTGSYAMDQIVLFKNVAGSIPLKVEFSARTYTVEEGDTAIITATLNMTATYPVTVTYTTADETALAGVDYVSTTNTLVFPPDTLTQSFTVTTLDNDIEDGARTVQLILSDPLDVELGAVNQATLLIEDNEAIDLCCRRLVTVDDFEDGLLPVGEHGTIDIGFVTWSDGSPVAITTTIVADSDPRAMTGQTGDNVVLQLDATISSWGGLSHLFMNEAGDTWISQDWSRYAGIGFWLYGEGDGTGLFFEIKDNRTGSDTQDDAEIWTYPFTDDVAGWRYVEIPFSQFTRKEIGNNAPNDGFGRTEVHGWAFGSLTTDGAQTLYLDNVALLERVVVVDDFESGLPTGSDAYGNNIGFVTWGDFEWDPGTTTAITLTDPAIPPMDALALPCQTMTNTVLQADYTVAAGRYGGFSHAFENSAVSEWVSQDWSTYEGLSLWLYGANTGGNFRLDLFDNRAATGPYSTTDSAERFFYVIPDDFTGWQRLTIPFANFTRRSDWQPDGAPDDGLTLTEVWGYAIDLPAGVGAQTAYFDSVVLYGDTRMPALTVAFAAPTVAITEGQTANIVVTLDYTVTKPVSVTYTTAESLATPDRDFTPVSGTLVIAPGELMAEIAIPTLEDIKSEGAERVAVLLFDPEGAELGFQRRTILMIVDNDPADPNLLDDFEGSHPFSGTVALDAVEVAATSPLARPGQGDYEYILQVDAAGAGDFVRTYPVGQDWADSDGLGFWFYGTNSSENLTVQLLDNQAASTAEVDPTDWVLAWSQEFNEPTGTAPDNNVWSHELGDGALNGIVGWGNSELQYYTDSTDNAATDGTGNLKISITQVNTETSDLVCHYGMCEYTSARLISANKMEFAYGRVEARIKVPSGAGLWPAFWMLGTNIDEVPWPACGEIDIMEYVGRVPNEIFGTLHGPGYSGGNGFGNAYDFGYPVATDYHTFTLQWSPDEIHWYVDDILYHSATPADVAPNQWVYNHPFYIILNMAIGGNFGGPVDPALTYPKEMLIDYVRVYQAEDTAERFEATFTDNFTGWRKVSIPFSTFVRSATQPEGAPDDGLTLSEIWGYGFSIPTGSEDTFYLDDIRLIETADLAITKTRSGTDIIISGDTITFNLSVVNLGPTDPAVARVVDTWSPVEAVVAVDAPDFCDVNLETGTIECIVTNLGTLAALPFPVAFTTADDFVGVLANEATISAEGGIVDLIPENNTATVTATLSTAADLAITKTRSGTDVIIPGDTITFNLSVANLGPTDPVVAKVVDTWSPVEAVVAVDAPDFCDINLEAGTIECTVADLGTLAALPFPVAFTTADDFVGVLANEATVSVEGSIVDLYTDNNTAVATATLTAVADLDVKLTDTPDPVAVDEALIYTIIVTNDGPISATQVMVTDTLPITVSFGSATTSQGTCEAPAGQSVVCNLGTMDKGDVVTITLHVTPTAAGNFINVVNVAAKEYDPDLTNNTANTTTTAEISRYTIFLPLVKRND